MSGSDHYPPARLGPTSNLPPFGDEGGLEEHIAEVYLLTIRNPGVSRATLAASALMPEVVDSALERLVARGLVRPGTEPQTWEATPPDLALPALANRLDRRAANARTIAGELAILYHQARSNGEPGGDEVRVLHSQQELANATSGVLSCARTEILAVHDGSPQTANLLTFDAAQHRPPFVAPDGRPVRLRAVYDTSVLLLPHAGDVLRARIERGEEYRFINRVPFSVTIADDIAAVVDLTSYDSSGLGSLYVSDRRLVLALTALAESYWRLATPMAAEGGTHLDDRSLFILSLMAAGATDSMIAAQSGISQRTVERKVRALLDQLGAKTRFQAGVQAARRGWL